MEPAEPAEPAAPAKDEGLDLHEACKRGMTETAEALLDRGAEVDLHNTDGDTALMLACHEGHTETARMLLDRGAEANLQDTGGWTALMIACEFGHAEAAKLLLDRDAKVDLQNTDGVTALMNACENGHVETAKLLLDRGAEVDLQDTDGVTALKLACLEGHKEAAMQLLDDGAKVDLQDNDGLTALMMACHIGQTGAAKLLLDHGAKMELQNPNDLTALMLACQNGQAEAAQLLVDRGVKVDLQTPDGWTALMMACNADQAEVAQLRLGGGAKVDLQGNDGQTALMMACLLGYTEIAKLLFDRGARADLTNQDLGTALTIACTHGHTKIVRLLLDHGANVDYQHFGGWTSLIQACYDGHLDVIKVLLDFGAKVNMRDAAGKTALVRATQCDHVNLGRAEMDRRAVSVIDLLCTRSGRLNFADLDGPAALASARSNKLNATADLLEFLSDSSPLAPYGLLLPTLACFYARNVRTPQAAANLSGPELYFMGLRDTKQRQDAMKRFRDGQSGGDALDVLKMNVERARDAHKRGQEAIDRNLGDLQSLLSMRPCDLGASHDFDVAMRIVREAMQGLTDLQARVADDVSLVDERDEARDKLATLMTATISGAFQHSIERLGNTENVCSRMWACLSDDPLTSHVGPRPTDQDVELACQAAEAAIAVWKKREKVILARRETEAAVGTCDSAAHDLSHLQFWNLWLRDPTRLQELIDELEAVKSTLREELCALRDDDAMAEVPLAEIRCALELITRRQVEARDTELARCRAAALAVAAEVDKLVKNCSKPSTAALEGLTDRIHEVQTQREVLEMKVRHAQCKWPRAGAKIDADKLAKLEEELDSLSRHLFELDRELCRERARVIRHAERYSRNLVEDPAWQEQIGLLSEALIGVSKLELWLAYVTRADFVHVEPLAMKPGKEVYKVREPDGREVVLKSFHLVNGARADSFCRQVQALAEIESAYIVRIEALFLDASFGHILMPYYAGGDLASWIRDNPHACDETRKRIAVGVLSGVHALHQRSLVHCEIKAENIFLTEALTPVLGYFETMRQPLEAADRYVAPELLNDGASKFAPAMDLFAVGVVLGEIFPRPSAALEDLIGKLQAEDPKQRPSALEALEHEALQTRPIRS